MAATKKNGYVQVSFGGKKIGTLNNLSFYIENKKSIQDGYHLSHLCSQPLCFNPKHLVEETPI